MSHFILCSKCKTKIEYVSSDIGNLIKCSNCGYEIELPVPEFKKYELPEFIWIYACMNEIPLENIAILFNYGFNFGPLFTNNNGKIILTKQFIEESIEDEISTGIMEHKTDYRFNKYLKVIIPTKEELMTLVSKRQNSGWGLLKNEENKWGSFENFINVCKNAKNNNVQQILKLIDLESSNDKTSLIIDLKS